MHSGPLSRIDSARLLEEACDYCGTPALHEGPYHGSTCAVCGSWVCKDHLYQPASDDVRAVCRICAKAHRLYTRKAMEWFLNNELLTPDEMKNPVSMSPDEEPEDEISRCLDELDASLNEVIKTIRSGGAPGQPKKRRKKASAGVFGRYGQGGTVG